MEIIEKILGWIRSRKTQAFILGVLITIALAFEKLTGVSLGLDEAAQLGWLPLMAYIHGEARRDIVRAAAGFRQVYKHRDTTFWITAAGTLATVILSVFDQSGIPQVVSIVLTIIIKISNFYTMEPVEPINAGEGK